MRGKNAYAGSAVKRLEVTFLRPLPRACFACCAAGFQLWSFVIIS